VVSADAGTGYTSTLQDSDGETLNNLADNTNSVVTPSASGDFCYARLGCGENSPTSITIGSGTQTYSNDHGAYSSKGCYYITSSTADWGPAMTWSNDSGTHCIACFTSASTAVDFTHTGAVYGTESYNSTRIVEKIFQGGLAQTDSWSHTVEKGSSLIDFTHQGAIAGTKTYASTKTKEALIDGTLNKVNTLASTKTMEYHAVEGALSQAKTLVSEKSVQYHPVIGDLSQTVTQSHTASGNISLAPSDNVAASAATETTPQLTPPDGKTTGDFTAGKISDDTNPVAVTVGAEGYTELEWTISVHAEQDEVFELRVTDAGTPITEAVTPTLTIGQVDFTHQGAIVATETFSSTKTKEALVQGTLAQTDTWNSARMTEHLWNADLFSTKTYGSTVLRDKIYVGTLTALETWASQKSVQYHTVEGTLSQAKTLSHDRTIERVIPGTIYSTDTWMSDTTFDTAAVNFLHTGAINAGLTWASTKIREAVLLGSIQAGMSWNSVTSKEVVIVGSLLADRTWISDNYLAAALNFLHTGDLNAVRTLLHTLSSEKVYTGALSSERTWSHEKTKEALIQAALTQLLTLSHDRTIERVINGTLGEVETWVSIKSRESVILGALEKQHIWSALVGGAKTVQGSLSQTLYLDSPVIYEGVGTLFGNLNTERTWGHTVDSTRTLLIHVGSINGSRTWMHSATAEHLINGTLSQEMFFREHDPFSLSWGKDSGVDTVWLNKSATSDGWVKRSPETESWNKRGK
jgi:hypothetical protein